jgi:hypothetical protein
MHAALKKNQQQLGRDSTLFLPSLAKKTQPRKPSQKNQGRKPKARFWTGLACIGF